MSVHHAYSRRVVVTGMGIVSPLGVGIEPVWSRLVGGRSSIRRLPDDLVPDVAAKVRGVVPTREEDPEAGFDIDGVVSVKDQRKLGRFIAFALAASDEALAQAGFTPSTEAERERAATVIATGIGGFPEIAGAVRTTDERGTKRLSPFVIPSFLANLASGWVSIRHGLKGPPGSPVTACAAGVQAIGDAARMIRAGEVDVAVCGGAEACIDRVSLGGFAAARALSTAHYEDPALASRPFDAARDGFVMGEGAGILVIEALDHAIARGAVPIAELVGYGTSADAYHLTAGPEDGSGARRAMATALRQAGLDPTGIDHINAHATSTPVGDQGELAAIRALFGEVRPIITSTKSATGHLLGAAGGIEAVFSVLARRDGIVPPTLNLLDPDPLASGMDIVAGTARRSSLRTVLSNGFGFGGVNASLVFQRME
ncbi:beta-ketoacyl-ACP synthase II [Aureimonas phyllosphaerae]|uniref:3-oxoacyl-[acyl-carrier-protein] synthase 2 n=1 Tax=Aureimonas phyllosphaerae TaxID=1166078 RepID=A0A7W6FSM9_9HYPH|nr:beta-ketoacyl-ACP synthase II [Aureimonas phyllosphaerae]MBB3934126.1 3-oxoacyl-[acyl-carrier-protein] synthase II [Aureimonas phyllosphaerae]MBB3958658.1 3-oxoacyl-[acyl-carrier-protein] synthase II [Aureimonas phyllosphaerae]SFF17557.1 3-oxoacyl-[acyl-carrier-protein] synthase II [Aureimonas phyllosphaerae]